MNGGPFIWGLVAGIGVLALREIFVKLQNGKPIVPKFGGAEEEQSLTVTIRLRSGGMGDRTERERIIALEHQLSDAIENSSAGELDGDEFGGGTCTIYIWPQRRTTAFCDAAHPEKVPRSIGFLLNDSQGEFRSRRTPYTS